MVERCVILTYEAVLYWCWKGGQIYAHQLRQRPRRPRDKWHLDEMLLTINTDQLRSDGAATQETLPGVEYRQHRFLKNRLDNSHQPTRQRERRMQGFKSPAQAQRFFAASGPIAPHFRPRWHLLHASAYRREMMRYL
jgi:putative transposase